MSDPRTTGYYGRPAVKPSLYGWMVALYIFVAGIAGASQIIAAAVETAAADGGRTVIATARVLALAGAIAGGLLLILDLHTKRRFYNMLRIFRATSPMSLGTYILMAFGFFSLVAVAGEVFGPVRLATASGLAAALFGLGMTTYTAALLAATSTPLWAAAPRLLACRFAAAAMASGAATLHLAGRIVGGDPGQLRAVAVLAAIAVAVELAASLAADWRYRALAIDRPLRQLPWGPVHVVGVQLLGGAVPVALYVYGLTAGGSLATLAASGLAVAGGMLMRGVVLETGNRSAERPQDYFRFAGDSAPAGPGR